MDTHRELAPLSATPAATHPSSLDRRRKAAIIVRLLVKEGAEIPLSELPDELQAELAQEMGAMRYVDRDTLRAVIDEFADELERVGLAFPGGMAGALDALDGHLSAPTAARLRREAGVRQSGDPWARLGALSPKELLPFVTAESIEVAAVLLSKLETSKAAALLGLLPGARARRITYAVSLTAAITPEAVDRIGLALAAQLDARPPRAFPDEPVQRVGAILDSSAAATRDDVLEGLEETDRAFAERVRQAIFTFADIPGRLEPRDAGKILREMEQPVLARALAAAEASDEGLRDAAAFLLDNISSRLADTLREEMAGLGEVSAQEGEEAITEVVGVIRRLERAGEIRLATPPPRE